MKKYLKRILIGTTIIYLRGRVLIEYLMNVRGIRYDEILSDHVQEQEISAELKGWYEAQGK